MKRIFIPLISLVLLAVSCGPTRHAVNIEMRYPSKAGLELSGKTLSVVYLENDNQTSNNFNEGIADGFAYALEKDYGTGEGSVGIYKMRSHKGAEYATRDSLINLLVDTGSDVVFLIDTLKIGPVLNNGQTQFTMTLYCFDAMDQTEEVHTYKGSTAARLDEGNKVGNQVASSFKSVWKHEQYSLTYFDNEKWYKALDRAEAYDWKGAMDMWITLLSTNDMLRRSCAEYNIATACYMLGEYDLALEWLDRSDKDNKLPYSDALRKRINERRAF